MEIKKMTTEQLTQEVKKSILKQKEILSKNGVDLGKQWKEMQKSIKN